MLNLGDLTWYVFRAVLVHIYYYCSCRTKVWVLVDVSPKFLFNYSLSEQLNGLCLCFWLVDITVVIPIFHHAMDKSGVKPITLLGNFEMLASIRTDSNGIHVFLTANHSVQDKHNILSMCQTGPALQEAACTPSVHHLRTSHSKDSRNHTSHVSKMCPRQELDGVIMTWSWVLKVASWTPWVVYSDLAFGNLSSVR